MRFGKSRTEAEKEPNRALSGGGDFIKYLREGDTTFRILQEPDEWAYYWEHFSPEGYSFACNEEEDCPGCISESEKMKRVSRKIAFNVLQGFNGTDYVNVYKIGPMVEEKLNNRYLRLGTITDRDYTITKYKTTGDRWDFDVDGGTPTPLTGEYEKKDVEKLLLQQWEEHWGASASEPKDHSRREGYSVVDPPVRRPTIAPAPKPQGHTEEPPFEEEVYQEADLRKMDHGDLLTLLKDQMKITPPASLESSEQVVDWLMDLQQS